MGPFNLQATWLKLAATSISVISITMVAGEATALGSFSSVVQVDLRQLSSSLADFVSPEMANQLAEAIYYALTMLAVASFLALISFAGCCGLFKKSRFYKLLSILSSSYRHFFSLGIRAV